MVAELTVTVAAYCLECYCLLWVAAAAAAVLALNYVGGNSSVAVTTVGRLLLLVVTMASSLKAALCLECMARNWPLPEAGMDYKVCSTDRSNRKIVSDQEFGF